MPDNLAARAPDVAGVPGGKAGGSSRWGRISGSAQVVLAAFSRREIRPAGDKPEVPQTRGFSSGTHPTLVSSATAANEAAFESRTPESRAFRWPCRHCGDGRGQQPTNTSSLGLHHCRSGLAQPDVDGYQRHADAAILNGADHRSARSAATGSRCRICSSQSIASSTVPTALLCQPMP